MPTIAIHNYQSVPQTTYVVRGKKGQQTVLTASYFLFNVIRILWFVRVAILWYPGFRFTVATASTRFSWSFGWGPSYSGSWAFCCWRQGGVDGSLLAITRGFFKVFINRIRRNCKRNSPLEMSMRLLSTRGTLRHLFLPLADSSRLTCAKCCWHLVLGIRLFAGC